MIQVIQVSKGNFKTHKTSIKAFPYAFFTPETQLAFGVGGIMAFYTAKARILQDFQLKELKPSYGFGLRFLFNPDEKVNVRVDFGEGGVN